MSQLSASHRTAPFSENHSHGGHVDHDFIPHPRLASLVLLHKSREERETHVVS